MGGAFNVIWLHTINNIIAGDRDTEAGFDIHNQTTTSIEPPLPQVDNLDIIIAGIHDTREYYCTL